MGAVAVGAIALAVVLLIAGLALTSAALASGSQAPEFKDEVFLKTFSTRAFVSVIVFGEQKAQWEASYAPAEAGGAAPSESSLAWASVNSGTLNGPDQESISIGHADSKYPNPSLVPDLRHLAPGTAYYARFIVKDAGGEARKLVAFTTLPAGKPEVTELINTIDFTGPGPAFTFKTLSVTSFSLGVSVETNGSDTTYRSEYALSENGHAPAASSPLWRSFTSDPSGTVTAAEEYAWVEVQASGLEPETTYYVRLRLSNAIGETVQVPENDSFTTPSAKAKAEEPSARNVTTTSAFVAAQVVPRESQTEWRLEWAEAPSGPWTAVSGGSGTISQAVAEAAGYELGFYDGARLTGLNPSTVYYVRAVAENSCKTGCGKDISSVASFETTGSPTASVFSAHGLDGESLRLLGLVNPNSLTSTAEQVIALEGAAGGTFTLTFKGDTTTPIPFNASANAVGAALVAAGAPEVAMEGLPGGRTRCGFIPQVRRALNRRSKPMAWASCRVGA